MITRIVNKNEYKILTIIHLQVFVNLFFSSFGKHFLRTYFKVCLRILVSIGLFAVNNDNQIQMFRIE